MRFLILTMLLIACGVREPIYVPAPTPTPNPVPSCNEGKVTWNSDVKAIIDNRCLSCHKNFKDKGVVASDISAILQRVNNGSMPPPPRTITNDEIKKLEQWKTDGLIEKCEAPTVPPVGSYFGARERELAAFNDIRTLSERADPVLKKNTRYVDICHLYNSGLKDLNNTRFGIDKFLNSLSTERTIAHVHWFADSQCLGRIDIRDYGWNADKWELIVAKNSNNIVSKTDEGKFVQGITGTAVPIFKGDSLVFLAGVPPLYYQMLGIPNTLGALEVFADVDKAKSLAEKSVRFAGITGSIVAKNNRLLTVWPQANRTGTFRESFDFLAFDANNLNRNLFAFPGKVAFGFTNNFTEAGGEIIWTLENGLQAYAVINAAGQVLNEAPIDVVFDPIRNEAIKPGINCMACHNEGSKLAKDQVREHIHSNPGNFDPRDVSLSDDFYVSHGAYDALIGKIRAGFDSTLRLVGGNIGTKEPIGPIFANYEKDIDFAFAAADLGVPDEEFAQCLKGDNRLLQNLGGLLAGGKVPRGTWDSFFQQIVSICQLDVEN